MCGNPTRKDRLLLKLHDHFPKVRLPLWATLLAAVLLAGAITLLALWCQPNALRSVLAVFRAQPLLIILNCLPVGMLLLVFTCLLRNVFFAGALANFAVCALSIANRIKIEVRDEPVFPRDFALLKEAGSAVGTYDIQFPVPSIAAVVVFSLVLVALGLFVGSRPFPIARLRGWVGSLLGAAASFAVLAGLILTARLGSAQSTSGTGIEMDAIAAVILGGTSLSGGVGFVLPTVVGAMIMGIIDNILTLMNVNPHATNIVKGAVILIAVLVDKKVKDLSAKAE